MILSLFKKTFFLIILLNLISPVFADDLIAEFDFKPEIKKIINLPYIDHVALNLKELNNGNLLISSSHKFFEYSEDLADKYKRVYITKDGAIVGQLKNGLLVFIYNDKLGIYSTTGKKLRDLSLKITCDYSVKKAYLLKDDIIVWIDSVDYPNTVMKIDLEGNILWEKFLDIKNFNVSNNKIYFILDNEPFEISHGKMYKPENLDKNLLFVVNSNGQKVALDYINSDIRDIVGFDDKYVLRKTDSRTVEFLDSKFSPIAKFDQMDLVYSINIISGDRILITGEGRAPDKDFNYVLTEE